MNHPEPPAATQPFPPPHPHPHPYPAHQPEPEPRNGFGITALSLAVPGLVFGLVPLTGFLAVILGALAVIFGGVGLGRVRRGRATNRVMTWFGLVLGALALVLGVIGVVIVLSAVEELDREIQEIGEDFDRDMAELEQERDE